MKALFAHIEFAKPPYFWLLLALPLLCFATATAAWAVLIARTVILLLLTFDPRDPQKTQRAVAQ